MFDNPLGDAEVLLADKLQADALIAAALERGLKVTYADLGYAALDIDTSTWVNPHSMMNSHITAA